MSGKLTDWEKQKSTYFCCVSHDLKLCEDMIKIMPDFTYYAYIRHEPDSEEGTPHYHFIVRNNGTRSVKQVADKLGISSNFVQPCRKVVAYRRYLLHLDNDEKIKYSLDDVVTNDMPSMKSAVVGNDKRDINSIFTDWNNLLSGKITRDEFIQLNWLEIQKMTFYQKIKTFELLDKYAHNTT